MLNFIIMADSDSDNELKSNAGTSYTTVIGAFATSIVPKLKSGLDPIAHKSQKNCRICGINVKGTHLMLKSKRFNCKFCHNAVCERCSNIRCFHTGKGAVQRICNGCFYEAVEAKFKEECKEEIEKFTQIAIEEKRLNESEMKRIEEETIIIGGTVSERKRKLLELNEKIDELMQAEKEIIFEPNAELEKLENLVREKNLEMELLVETMMEKTKKINEVNNEIVNCDLKISDLIAEIEIEKNSKMASALNRMQKDAKNLEILKNQIISHSGVVSTLKHDIQNLKNKLGAPKQDKDCTIQ